MKIIGHGIDIIPIDKIEKLLEMPGGHFERRCFTRGELDAANKDSYKVQFFAGRFAAKEAVLKALGTGWTQGISWTDIEIQRLPSGGPEVVLHGRCKEIASDLGVSNVLLSISHTDSYALASAIAIAL